MDLMNEPRSPENVAAVAVAGNAVGKVEEGNAAHAVEAHLQVKKAFWKSNLLSEDRAFI